MVCEGKFMEKNKLIAVVGVILACSTSYFVGYLNGSSVPKEENSHVVNTISQSSESSSESFSYDPAKGRPEKNNLVWIKDVDWTRDKLKQKFGIAEWSNTKNVYKGTSTSLDDAEFKIITDQESCKIISVTTKKKHVINVLKAFGVDAADVTFGDFLTSPIGPRHDARSTYIDGVAIELYHWSDSPDDEYDILFAYMIEDKDGALSRITFDYKLSGAEIRSKIEHLYDY